MSKIYAIQCGDTKEWYKPSCYPKYKMWSKDFKKAKIYSNIGYAKAAITCKLEALEGFKGAYSWIDPKELEAYKKFKSAVILVVGEVSTYYNV